MKKELNATIIKEDIIDAICYWNNSYEQRVCLWVNKDDLKSKKKEIKGEILYQNYYSKISDVYNWEIIELFNTKNIENSFYSNYIENVLEAEGIDVCNDNKKKEKTEQEIKEELNQIEDKEELFYEIVWEYLETFLKNIFEDKFEYNNNWDRILNIVD